MTLKAHGNNSAERIIFAGLFAPAPTGRRGLPYVLIGDPGGGKTSAIKRLVRQAGLHYEGVMASLREPTDFLGVPVPKRIELGIENAHLSADFDDTIMAMEYSAAPFAIRSALASEGSVIFFDEVNTARPNVQAALLRVLFEGIVGDLQLPDSVRFLLAMNRVEDAAGGWDLAPPLANRMGHLQYESPSVEGYTAYLIGGGARAEYEQEVDPVSTAAQVDAQWGEAWAAASGKIAGFLAARPGLLHKKPQAGSPESSKAWPSPRTWDFAATALAIGEIFDLTPREIQESVDAFVGSGAATELHTWIRNADLPRAQDILDGTATFEHNPARLDRTAAVATACTGLLIDAKDPEQQKEWAKNLWTVYGGIAPTAPDLILHSVSVMIKNRLNAGHRESYKVLAEMEPILSAAGVVQ